MIELKTLKIGFKVACGKRHFVLLRGVDEGVGASKHAMKLKNAQIIEIFASNHVPTVRAIFTQTLQDSNYVYVPPRLTCFAVCLLLTCFTTC